MINEGEIDIVYLERRESTVEYKSDAHEIFSRTLKTTNIFNCLDHTNDLKETSLEELSQTLNRQNVLYER